MGISRLTTNTLISPPYLNKISKIKKPKYILLYVGGNDLRNDLDNNHILENITHFIVELRNMYSHPHITILSIIKSPIMIKENRIQDIIYVNNLLKKNSKKLDYHYLDINKELDNYNFFKEDKLHLNKLGYTKLSSTLPMGAPEHPKGEGEPEVLLSRCSGKSLRDLSRIASGEKTLNIKINKYLDQETD
jgi:lysophospholipase L1-like esterase